MSEYANLQRYISEMQTAVYKITGEVQKLRDENEALKSRYNNQKVLNADQVRDIKAMAGSTDISCQALADSYGVNRSTISRILNGTYHKNIR